MKLFKFITLAILLPAIGQADSLGSDLIGDSVRCSKHLKDLSARFQVIEGLSQEQREFLEQMSAVFGRRLLQEDPESIRSCVDGACLLFKDFSVDEGQRKPRDLRIEFVDMDTPRIEIVKERGLKTLKVPKGFKFKDSDEARAYFMALAMGHPLHPFMASKTTQAEREALGEERYFLKPAQVEAAKAVQYAVDRIENNPTAENRRILVVAPTGTGKTKILESFLGKIIPSSLERKKKLHFVTAHTDALVNQLFKDVYAFGKEGEDYHVVRWPHRKIEGVKNPKGPQTIEDLEKFVEQSDKPVVVVGTIQTVNARMAGGTRLGQNPTEKTLAKWRSTVDANAQKLVRHLGSFTQDEAHHSNAPLTKDVIKSLIDHKDSRAMLYGTTATPFHSDPGLIEGLYGKRAFWAYLDTAEQFREFGGRIERDIEEIVDQLSRAIKSGELTPFRKTYFMLPEDFTTKDDFYIARNEINRKYFPQLIEKLKPRFRERNRGFISVGSVEEANDLAKALNDADISPKRTFAALHSDMSSEDQRQVMADFKAGKINYLVTIRMLDEGIDVPDISLYIDLNKTVGPRQLLQRVGRVLRLAPNKESIDIVTMMGIDEATLRDNIHLLAAIKDGKLRSDIEIREVDEDGKFTLEELENQEVIRVIERIEQQMREKDFWKQHGYTLGLADDLIEWQRSRPWANRLPVNNTTPGRDLLSNEYEMIRNNKLMEISIRSYPWTRAQAELEGGIKSRLDKFIADTREGRRNEKERQILLDALNDFPEMRERVEKLYEDKDDFADRLTKVKDRPGRVLAAKWLEWVELNEVRVPTADEAPELRAQLEKMIENGTLWTQFYREFRRTTLPREIQDVGSKMLTLLRWDSLKTQAEKDAFVLNYVAASRGEDKFPEITALERESSSRATKSVQTLVLLQEVALRNTGIEQKLENNPRLIARSLKEIDDLRGTGTERLPQGSLYEKMVSAAARQLRNNKTFHRELTAQFGEQRKFYGIFTIAGTREVRSEEIQRFLRSKGRLPLAAGGATEEMLFEAIETQFPDLAKKGWQATNEQDKKLYEHFFGDMVGKAGEFFEVEGRAPSLKSEPEANLASFIRAVSEDPKLGRTFANKLIRSEREVYDAWIKEGRPKSTHEKKGSDIAKIAKMTLAQIASSNYLDKAQSDKNFATELINHHFENTHLLPSPTGTPFERLVFIALKSHQPADLALSRRSKEALSDD